MRQQLIFNYNSIKGDANGVDMTVEYNPLIPQNNKLFLAQEPARQKLQIMANQMAKEFLAPPTGTHVNRSVAKDLPTDGEWYTYSCKVKKSGDELLVVSEALVLTPPEVTDELEKLSQHVGG